MAQRTLPLQVRWRRDASLLAAAHCTSWPPSLKSLRSCGPSGNPKVRHCDASPPAAPVLPGGPAEPLKRGLIAVDDDRSSYTHKYD